MGKRTSAAAFVLVTGMAGLVPNAWAGGATAATPTCHGRPATIVGTPGRTLTGTPGDDVIVTNNASEVDAQAGNDLICVTGNGRSGGGPGDEAVLVGAGPGDDDVDARAVHCRGCATNTYGVDAALDSGRDSYQGTNGDDTVIAFDTTEPDVIASRGGRDRVRSGDPEKPNAVNDDVIYLGGMGDTLDLAGQANGAKIDAGPLGRVDGLDLLNCCSRSEYIDNVAGQIWSGRAPGDGPLVVHYTGAFESFLVRESLAFIGFRGTDQGEGLDFLDDADGNYDPPRYTHQVDLSMGGGSDHVTLEGSVTGTMHGGTGTDYLDTAIDAKRTLTMSLSGDVIADGVKKADLRGFDSIETGTGASRAVTVAGTRGPDRVVMYESASSLIMRGGRGDDYLERHVVTHGETGTATLRGGKGEDILQGNHSTDRLVGGTGRDLLRGSWGDDVLRGGPGRDRAYGGRGHDRCSAEVRHSC